MNKIPIRKGTRDLEIYSHEDVRTTLSPNIEVRGCTLGSVGVVTALAALIDVVLDDGGPNHRKCGELEA